eukprot:14071923-Ditylum_brightwellii.AAC.1
MSVPATAPDKHLRPSFTQNDNPELAKKRRKATKGGRLKKYPEAASANLLISQSHAAASIL